VFSNELIVTHFATTILSSDKERGRNNSDVSLSRARLSFQNIALLHKISLSAQQFVTMIY